MKNETDPSVYLVCYNFKTVRLNRRQPTTIGREKYNDIVLNDLMVSRQHALLCWENDVFVLKDLNSRNGTFLNGKKISSVALKDGDIIKIGSYEFALRAASGMDVEKMLLKEKGRIASHETIVDSDLGISFSDSGFSGNLAALSLVEVVQTLSQCLKTGLLTISSDRDAKFGGKLFFKEGEIVHAELKGNTGVGAVIAILNLPEGQFEFKNDVLASEQTVQESTVGLLMEACRRQDEEHRQETQS
ncbi:FHA domain-containing protein [bacterium]|nr:FHA domain-containing protein [candidate division CSSED10-310 bacterium]